MIVVLGASGNQGGAVARHLAGTGFQVRGAARETEGEAGRKLKDDGIEPVSVELNDETSLRSAFEGAHGVYVVLPFFQEGFEREVEMGHRVIAAAEAAGVKHLVYSAGARSNERTGVPHLDSKGEVERSLRASSLPWTVLRPVAFNYSLAAYRDSVLQGVLPDPRSPDSLVYQVDEADHATFAALAFLDPANWLGRGFETMSEAVTVTELAEIFARVTGRTVGVQRITWEEEAAIAGDEVVRLAKWVEADGPRLDQDIYRSRYPWLSTIEGYLRSHGWADLGRPVSE